MARVKGLSLWLMPEGNTHRRLKKIIEAIAAELRSPLFDPHITLLGQASDTEDEVLEKTAALASSLTAFEVSSGGPGFLDRYFQALFVKVKEDPALMDAGRAACQAFNRGGDRPYMPHLSLAYGDLDLQKKECLVARLSGEADFSFLADKIHLYATGGEPEDWRPIKTFPLQKP